MAVRKKMLINAFSMNCVGHINHGLWSHPRDRSGDYRRLSYWTDLAATLERGLFDGLFLADILGVYDVYGGSVDLTLRESVQLPVNDPLMLISAMAAVTRHLGFGVTVNTSNEAPYTFARRMSTLDHLTNGRIGWNIVTGYLDSAARALGDQGMIDHDTRYDRADDYLDVLYKLWEGSWEEGAILADRSRRIYADPARVKAISHDGPYYRCEGYHLSEPSPQRTPVLFQAGTSGRGQAFAARHAECVFITGSDRKTARSAVDALRAAVGQAGRSPDSVRILMGITVVPGRTAAEAREKHADYIAHASPEAGLAHFSAGSGIDLSRYGPDDPIAFGTGNAIQSVNNAARRAGLTRRALLEQLAIGGRYPVIVGDGGQVAEELISWMDETGIDGFNLTRTVVPECYEDFVDIVVPELQARGAYKTAYTDGTLRHALFQAGDRLPAHHYGSRFRTVPKTRA